MCGPRDLPAAERPLRICRQGRTNSAGKELGNQHTLGGVLTGGSACEGGVVLCLRSFKLLSFEASPLLFCSGCAAGRGGGGEAGGVGLFLSMAGSTGVELLCAESLEGGAWSLEGGLAGAESLEGGLTAAESRDGGLRPSCFEGRSRCSATSVAGASATITGTSSAST